jgi:hypothetical protein
VQIDAILCEAATIRDGLLNVLSAGITRVYRESYPSLMGTQLAMVLHCSPKEAGKAHKMVLSLVQSNKQKAAEVSLDFSVSPAEAKSPLQVSVPLVANFTQQVLPTEGVYELEIAVDGKVLRTLQFQAARPVAAAKA